MVLKWKVTPLRKKMAALEQLVGVVANNLLKKDPPGGVRPTSTTSRPAAAATTSKPEPSSERSPKPVTRTPSVQSQPAPSGPPRKFKIEPAPGISAPTPFVIERLNPQPRQNSPQKTPVLGRPTQDKVLSEIPINRASGTDSRRVQPPRRMDIDPPPSNRGGGSVDSHMPFGSSSSEAQSSQYSRRKFKIEMPQKPGLGAMGTGFPSNASVAPSDMMGINVVGAGSAMSMHPAMAWMYPPQGFQILQTAKKPSPFTGREGGDWQQFVREWIPYERIMEQAFPEHFWDTIKLETLKGLLDHTTLTDFQAKWEANDGIKFSEFWEELDKELGRDATHQNRAAWKKVQLNIRGKKLTLSEWRTFQKEFTLKRGRVDDRTEHEEHALLFVQLPQYWANEVGRENSRRSNGKYWIKITNLPDMTRADVMNVLAELNCLPKEVIKQDSGFLVRCTDEEDQTHAVKVSGAKIDGRSIKITRTKFKMSADDIFKFVTERLQTTEETEDLRRTLGPQLENREVRRVTLGDEDDEEENTSSFKNKEPEKRPDKKPNSPPKERPRSPPKVQSPRPRSPPQNNQNKGKGDKPRIQTNRGWGHDDSRQKSPPRQVDNYTPQVRPSSAYQSKGGAPKGGGNNSRGGNRAPSEYHQQQHSHSGNYWNTGPQYQQHSQIQQWHGNYRQPPAYAQQNMVQQNWSQNKGNTSDYERNTQKGNAGRGFGRGQGKGVHANSVSQNYGRGRGKGNETPHEPIRNERQDGPGPSGVVRRQE